MFPGFIYIGGDDTEAALKKGAMNSGAGKSAA